MIVSPEFLNKLKDFGLNSYEAKLWTALLSRGVATAGELSDIANVPRSRSYDVLESLEKKGFVMMKLGKPIKYIAVDPSEVIERVKNKIVLDSERQAKLIEGLKGSDLLNELVNLHTHGIQSVEPGDLSGAVQGRESLFTHLISVIKTAKKSIVLITTEDGLIRKAQNLRNALTKAKKRGVQIKIIAPLTKKNKQAATELKSIAEVRTLTVKLPRCMIVDNKQVVMMVLDDETTHPSADFGIWVDESGFAKSISSLFSYAWTAQKAKV